MDAGKPDRDPLQETAGRSLAGRLVAAGRERIHVARDRLARPTQARAARREATRADWIAAAFLALLIAIGPVVTIFAAGQMARSARADAARIESEIAPRVAAEAEIARARTQLAQVTAVPTLGTTLESLARALPADASLALIRRGTDGTLHIEVRTSDPDLLRTALRRSPATARLREAGQAREDAAIRVTLVERTR